MCGIAGIIHKTNTPVAEHVIRSMIAPIYHRGPDSGDVICFDSLALGHRRLAILDLSPQGAQPMQYDESNLTIVHNGEIYNYRELRDDLRQQGYVFHSDTDTEVILASYLAWGEHCVEKFNGMWAFAIYDKVNNKIFCSRDRFGIKPFYYTNNEKGFYFGSGNSSTIATYRNATRKPNRS